MASPNTFLVTDIDVTIQNRAECKVLQTSDHGAEQHTNVVLTRVPTRVHWHQQIHPKVYSFEEFAKLFREVLNVKHSAPFLVVKGSLQGCIDTNRFIQKYIRLPWRVCQALQGVLNVKHCCLFWPIGCCRCPSFVWAVNGVFQSLNESNITPIIVGAPKQRGWCVSHQGAFLPQITCPIFCYLMGPWMVHHYHQRLSKKCMSGQWSPFVEGMSPCFGIKSREIKPLTQKIQDKAVHSPQKWLHDHSGNRIALK